MDNLRIKVDSEEVGFFVANDERLRKVETARFVDTGNPTLIDLLLKATVATTRRTTTNYTQHRYDAVSLLCQLSKNCQDQQIRVTFLCRIP